GVGVAFPAAATDEPSIRRRLRARQQTFALLRLRVSFVFQFWPAWNDLAHAFARKLERTRQRLFTISRRRRQGGREKLGRRLRFNLLFARAGIGIELRRRQRRLGLWRLIVLRQKIEMHESQIAMNAAGTARGTKFKRLALSNDDVDAEQKSGQGGRSPAPRNRQVGAIDLNRPGADDRPRQLAF